MVIIRKNDTSMPWLRGPLSASWLRWHVPILGQSGNVQQRALWSWDTRRQAATAFDTLQEAQDTLTLLNIDPNTVVIETL